MKEPQRLLDAGVGASELERSLLAAARADGPSLTTKASALAALGIAGGLTAAGKVAAAGTAVHATVHGAGSAVGAGSALGRS